MNEKIIYQGIEYPEYIEYRGIPYAKPPVGPLRWKAPQSLKPETGEVPALFHGNKAWQDEDTGEFYNREFYDDPDFNVPMDEDCLYLNIWAPRNAHDAPVVIWIHGGSFDHGYASEKEFNGAEYAKRGIVFVSIQYRVGLLGFLAHEWLEQEDGFSGNYGLLDQIAAIEWVIDNISRFGGNPENITLMGQSAGAMSVQSLVSSPLVRDRISKAILQSGGSYREGLLQDVSIEEQKKIGDLFARIMEVENLEQLRSLTPEQLMEGYAKLRQEMKKRTGNEFIFLVPSIDGKILPKGYDSMMEEGLIADIPYMIGSTKNDIAAMGTTPQESLLYRGSLAFSSQLETLGREPAWIYYFSRDLPGDDAGAFHSSELWYTMGTLDRSWRPFTDKDRDLSGQMIEYWANFIRTGDPNGSGLPEWKKGSGEVMIFDVPED